MPLSEFTSQHFKTREQGSDVRLGGRWGSLLEQGEFQRARDLSLALALVWETWQTWPWSRAGCWTTRQRQERLDWDPSKSQTSKRAAAADPQFVSREHVVVPVGRLSSRRRDRDLASRIGLAWSSAQLERRGLATQAQAAARQLSAASMHFALA